MKARVVSFALFLLCCSPSASHTPPSPSPNAAAALRNTLYWSTASEESNFGFDVYRATSARGPFACITERPIAGAGTSDEPHDYAYADEAIEAETAYFYYVESISFDGQRRPFTPIIEAPPKTASRAPEG